MLWKKEAGKNGFLLMSNDNTTSDNIDYIFQGKAIKMSPERGQE